MPTNSETGVYTVDVNGGAAASNPTDIASTPADTAFVTPDGLAIDPVDGHYFVASYFANGQGNDVNQIFEGNTNGSGTPTVIYTSGNSGEDAIVGLAFNQSNDLLYMAVTDANFPDTNTDTGIYTISAVGSGTRTATKLVNLSNGIQAPNDIAIDTTHNLLFYTSGFPGVSPTSVEEVGVASLSTGAIINADLVGYSASGNQQPYGIAVNPATDTLYWTTVNYSANSGNAVYSATYATNGSTLSNTQTLATTSQALVPIGIGLDIPQGGYYVDTLNQANNSAAEVLFGSSLTSPASLTEVYSVPLTDNNTETVPTEAIVVETQPTVTASGTVTYVEGQAAVPLDSSATVPADADGDYLASATVAIASGMSTGDTLKFTNQNGITGSYSSGTLTLTGVATEAAYQAALDSVTFSTTSTSATTRTIDWTVSDGVVTSPTATSTVAVHVAPTVTAGATVTFDGGGSPVVLDSGLVVTDPSSSTLASATIAIVGSIVADRLKFTAPNGISGTFNTTTGTLILSGMASLANYQTALELITYSVSPSNADPTALGNDTSRTIDWSVNDGVLNSGTVTSTLDTVHVAPTVTAGATATFDGGGAPVVLDSGLAVSDPDSGGVLSSATVTIAGAITGDTLNFTNSHPSTEGNVAFVSYSGGVLVLTSAGSTATLAQWQTALESVTYSFSPSIDDPTNGGGDTSRTIDWVVNDGVASSNTATSTLDVVHEPPVLNTGGTATFTGGGSAVALDPTLSLSDPDSGGLLSGATVSLAGFVAGDVLTANTTGLPSIIASYNGATGVLTLSGSDTLADYQAVLQSVTYSFNPSDGDPTADGSSDSRTVDWSITDGVASASNTSTLDEVHVAPTVTAGGSVTYPEGGAPVVLDPTVSVSDPDSGGNLVGATVTLSGELATDSLYFNNQDGIGGSYANGVLTLTGTSSLANYDTVLESVTYSNSGDPTDGNTDNSRTVAWVVNDGAANSAASDSSLETLCFCAGTRIATPRGEVAVQDLAVGDAVLTASGATRKIVWIGVGRVLVTRGRRSAATPVVVHKGALAPNVPNRDLRVSKGHALCLDEVLIPVEFLVNHRSIVWDDRAQEVSLYHVELETHDVLLANGAPAESYRDDGNRWLFQNANSGWEFPPLAPCRPVLTGGPIVDAAWRRLLDRAGPRPGVVVTDDPDLHLVVDGKRIDCLNRAGGRWTFRVTGAPREVRIMSHAVVPAELGLARDPRPLGVAIRRVGFRQRAEMRLLEAADLRLAGGFHLFEPDNGYRWTDGDALLPAELFAGARGPFMLELEVAETTRYPLLTAA